MGNTIEIIGIGVVALALIGLLTKVWFDSSKRSSDIIEMVKENSKALTRQADSNGHVAAAVKKQSKVLEENVKLLKSINGKIAEAARINNK